jgi:hypothetical protein
MQLDSSLLAVRLNALSKNSLVDTVVMLFGGLLLFRLVPARPWAAAPPPAVTLATRPLTETLSRQGTGLCYGRPYRLSLCERPVASRFGFV